jgi:hypothetical protein
MGAYVNPRGKDAAVWLRENGAPFVEGKTPLPRDFQSWRDQGKLVVCLVDNGPFSAAAVAFCQDELQVFTDLRDTRPKQWYVVPINLLYPVSNLHTYLPQESAD